MSELLAAVLGAVAAYVFDLRRSASARAKALRDASAERRRRRSSIATAILADLQTLEAPLRQFYNHPKPGNWKGQRPNLFFDSLRGDVREFAATSVHEVAEFFRRTDDLFSLLAKQESIPDAQREQLHYTVRAKAGFALQAMPAAKAALVAEGGNVPPVRQLDVIQPPALPSIPSRIFPDVSATPGESLPDEIR